MSTPAELEAERIVRVRPKVVTTPLEKAELEPYTREPTVEEIISRIPESERLALEPMIGTIGEPETEDVPLRVYEQQRLIDDAKRQLDEARKTYETVKSDPQKYADSDKYLSEFKEFEKQTQDYIAKAEENKN